MQNMQDVDNPFFVSMWNKLIFGLFGQKTTNGR